MAETLAVQPEERSFILPGIAENVRKDLDTISIELNEEENREKNRNNATQMQALYDKSVVALATKWFGVSQKAISKLTVKRRKELEEVILRKATELAQKKRVAGMFWKLTCRFGEDNFFDILGGLCVLSWLVWSITMGSPSMSVPVVVTSFILGPLLVGLSPLIWILSKPISMKVHALITAKKFLDSNEPKQLN